MVSSSFGIVPAKSASGETLAAVGFGTRSGGKVWAERTMEPPTRSAA